MDDIIASVEDFKFDIEAALNEQLGIQPLPFPGMDKSGAAICNFFLMHQCLRGQLCPLRHVRGDRMVVCKHWLRGLCKKGDDCEFLHQYDMEKMPECYFFNKFGSCSNKECPFLHLDPEAKIKDCPWYDRGFCKHGPLCKNRHVRRVMCPNYLCGFCPLGKKCKQSHPRHDLPQFEPRGPFNIVCHACGEVGHKSSNCAVAKRLAAEAVMRGELPEELKVDRPPEDSMPSVSEQEMANHTGVLPPAYQSHSTLVDGQLPQTADADPNVAPAAFIPYGKRPLDFVTCFKCRGKGHYANRCPFGASERQAGIPRSFRDRQQEVRPDLQRSVRMHMQNMQQHLQHLPHGLPLSMHPPPQFTQPITSMVPP